MTGFQFYISLKPEAGLKSKKKPRFITGKNGFKPSSR